MIINKNNKKNNKKKNITNNLTTFFGFFREA